jgi:copper(I)-binding protein
MRKNFYFWLFLVLFSKALPVYAFPESPLFVTGAFSRATKGKNGAVFLKIKNSTNKKRHLMAASISKNVADHCELHTHIKEGTVFQMRPVPHMQIPANDSLILQPGGLHIMLMNLKHPLNKDFLFKLTLEFDDQEKKEILVPIKSAGAKTAHCRCG